MSLEPTSSAPTGASELRAIPEELQLAIDTIPGLVWISQADGHIEFLNRRWLSYTGLQMEQATGWGWQVAVHTEDLPGLVDYWRALLAQGVPGEYEARLRRHDGVYRWFLFRGVPLHDASGRLLRWYGTNTDVDDRRASERLARGQLAALTHTLNLLANERDPENLPMHVVTTVLTQMDAHSATIWERQRDSLVLYGVHEGGAVWTREQTNYFEGALPVDGAAPPLWREGLRSGGPLVIEDVHTEPSRLVLADGQSASWPIESLTSPFVNLKGHLAAQGVRRLLICPMLHSGQLAGIIGVRFTGERKFGRDEIDLTRAMAQQALLCLRLMRLSRESRDAAVTAERNRLARDLHDTLAQGFTGVIAQLEAAKEAISGSNVRVVTQHIESAEELARSSLGEARRFVRAMRSRSLTRGTLITALEQLLATMARGTSLAAQLIVEGEHRELPAALEQGLLCIATESITNSIKHAHARSFVVTLTYERDRVRLLIADDGVGFETGAPHDGLGLIGMRERAVELGGQLAITSNPGGGTQVSMELHAAAMPSRVP